MKSAKMVNVKKTLKNLNRITFEGDRPCNGHKDECTPKTKPPKGK